MNREARKTRSSARSALDGESAGDAEDMDGEDDAHSRPSSVLWERHIEQSIFVDISDDDSLHFSDLQGAFTVHLSQASGVPESPQLTGKRYLHPYEIIFIIKLNYNGNTMVYTIKALCNWSSLIKKVPKSSFHLMKML